MESAHAGDSLRLYLIKLYLQKNKNLEIDLKININGQVIEDNLQLYKDKLNILLHIVKLYQKANVILQVVYHDIHPGNIMINGEGIP